MSDVQEYVAGSSSLVLGCDSYTSPSEVGEQELLMAQNCTVRGGIVQTRPGTRSLFCLPNGNFQGATLFTPDNGVAQLVAAVDGKIYVAPAPFTSYRRLRNLQFSKTAKYLSWAVTLKSTDYSSDGQLITLDDPYSILIMQDGLTRAAYWDGGRSGHLNPAPAPDATDVAVIGFQETPIGLWMIWAGNRLWVSRGNQVYASDIGNPTKFTEGQYLNEGRAFYLSGPCTGFIATPDQQGIIAFTQNDGTFFQSSIQDRTLWLSTPEFQKVILPNIGCVAPRSLVTQYGLNWWFASRGYTNFNAALRQNITSRIDYQDNEMFASKAYLGPDLSGVCASFYENYLMVSVPSGDVLNRHTWALDQAPFEGNANAWAGIWTGWRPIEWTRGIINGNERVFFGSIDYDGKNRIWEAMLTDRTDNGCPITCYAQLRDHTAQNLDQKRYEWTKFFLSQIYGEVDLNVYVASTKGAYQLQKGYRLVASKGQIFSETEYSEEGPFMIGNRVQSRIIRTPSDPVDNACNACGVESPEGNMEDWAFSHLLVWSGQMGIRAYQLHMRQAPERQDGDCMEDEVAPRTLNESGCSGLSLFVDGQVFESFTAYAEGYTTTVDGYPVYIRREAVSPISQANAQALADCAVQQVVNEFSVASVAPGVYDSGEAEIGNGTYVVVNAGHDVSDVPPPPPSANATILVVGGGGGGGRYYGAGGGGGQVIETTEAISAADIYAVTVGAGGTGAPDNIGTNGGSSSFAALVTALGGGAGGGGPTGSGIGGSGACGGGGGGISGGAGGVGSIGGNGGHGSGSAGAGGGGASGALGSNAGSLIGGNGAVGLNKSTSGSVVMYGSGAGGSSNTPGTGASGAGNGSTDSVASTPGAANRGGGGGGGSLFKAASDGGSGVVIVRYAGSPIFTGGAITTVGGDTVHTFNSSGNLTPL